MCHSARTPAGRPIRKRVGGLTHVRRLLWISGLCVGLTGAAQASMLGDSVDIQYVWPSAGSVYQDLGTITVTSSLQTVTFQPYFDVSVSANQVIVSDSNYAGGYSGAFNGEYVIDESVAAFPAYSIDPSSVLTGGAPVISVVGNTLEINFAGETFLPGEQLVLDIGPAAPEPAPFGLFGAGLGSFLILRRRRTA